MSIKLIAIDIDGTLLNENSMLNPATIETIKEAKTRGLKIVLCTGRPLIGVREYLDALGLTDEGDYVISYNGSLVQKAHNEEVIIKHSINYDEFIDLEALSRKLGIHCHTEDEHFLYTSNRDISAYTVHESHLTHMPLKYRTPEEMPRDVTFGKMMFIDTPEIVEHALKNLPTSFTERFNFLRSEPYFLEVLNKNANKGTGLGSLAAYLGFTAEECMAIGDADNDLDMIHYAGLGVAMANATDNVKNAAQVETLSNKEDGVAHAIRTYAFK